MDNDEDFSRHEDFSNKIGWKESRKIKSRRTGKNIWFGLGAFGVIGWSVTIPTVLGVALGIWIDGKWHTRFSWTLMLLCLGAGMGCLNAWHWIKQESHNE